MMTLEAKRRHLNFHLIFNYILETSWRQVIAMLKREAIKWY